MLNLKQNVYLTKAKASRTAAACALRSAITLGVMLIYLAGIIYKLCCGNVITVYVNTNYPRLIVELPQLPRVDRRFDLKIILDTVTHTYSLPTD